MMMMNNIKLHLVCQVTSAVAPKIHGGAVEQQSIFKSAVNDSTLFSLWLCVCAPNRELFVLAYIARH